MSDQTASIFTEEQRNQMKAIQLAVLQAGYKDPKNPPPFETVKEHYLKRTTSELYKPGAQLDMVRDNWTAYLFHAFTDGDKASTVRTAAKRKAIANKLKKALGKTPTVADLKTAYLADMEIGEEIIRILDEDLKQLVG